MLFPTRPPAGNRSLYETDVEELRLRDSGVDTADVAEALRWLAAASGWQCEQTNMVNPWPLQLLQILAEFLNHIILALSLSVDRGNREGRREWTNLGAFPAQLRHVSTVFPPMQDLWVGSSSMEEPW